MYNVKNKNMRKPKYIKVQLVTNLFEPSIQLISNHEIWRECSECGEVWDARKRGWDCPTCRKNKLISKKL